MAATALASMLALFGGCGEDAAGAMEKASEYWPDGEPGPGADGTDGTDGQDPTPPETETEVALQVPQGGDKYVFVVSTGLDAVVRIDAVSLGVDLIEVGGQPTEMRTLPGEDALVVVNQGTRDFSIVRMAEGAGTEVATVDSPFAVNRLEVSPDGKHALAWYDPKAGGPVGDLQAVVVVRLGKGEEDAHPVGVGFHVLGVTFTDEGPAKAFVTSESGISELGLADIDGPTFAPALAVSDPLAPIVDREVLVTPDGKWAVVRHGDSVKLRIIDLGYAGGEPGGGVKELTLGDVPTDVDLTPDAKGAIVVVRARKELVRVNLADPEESETIPLGEHAAGLATLTPDGNKAILFSTLAGNEWLAVLDLVSKEVTPYPLQKEVAAVVPAPDGKTAIVIHRKLEGSVLPEDDNATRVDKAYGYSVFDIATGYAKLELTPSDPVEVVLTPDGERAYLLVAVPGGAAGHHYVDDIDLGTLHVTPRPMGSPPRHGVYLPAADRVAVNQDHPVGRITFIDTQTGATQTVTGFELNGLIE